MNKRMYKLELLCVKYVPSWSVKDINDFKDKYWRNKDGNSR